MTEITYKDGILVVSQYGLTTIRFRICDTDFDSRKAIMEAVADITVPQMAGGVGFLKTQPVEARQAAIEEALGVSFPLGIGDEIDEGEATQIIENRVRREESDTLDEVIRRLRGE